MSGKAIFQENKTYIRIILLAAQILLPFGLYLAMQEGNQLLAIVMAVLLGLDMAVLVWLG